MITTKANKMTGASALICIKLLPVIIEENRRRKIFLFLGEKDRKATFHSKKFGNNDVKKARQRVLVVTDGSVRILYTALH